MTGVTQEIGARRLRTVRYWTFAFCISGTEAWTQSEKRFGTLDAAGTAAGNWLAESTRLGISSVVKLIDPAASPEEKAI